MFRGRYGLPRFARNDGGRRGGLFGRRGLGLVWRGVDWFGLGAF
jgi:hypothetical protein